jgi:hypothetical protein
VTDVVVVTDLPDGLMRVHWQPDVLKRPPYDLDPESMSRFDDPEGRFAIRYLATDLRGRLVETMSRFRPAPEVEALLTDVDGVEDDDNDPSRSIGLWEWLEGQKVGHCVIEVEDPNIVNVDAAESLIALDKHPLVRRALDQSGLGSAANPARLDSGVVRLPGRIGRPITQAVSRAVFEWYDGVHGLAYASRLDGSEPCWALYDTTPVTFTIEALSVGEPEHREAVQSVAALYEIELPDEWL